jgi:hypothetical protein
VTGDGGGVPLGDHAAAGHCQHCSCHHGATLPTATAQLAMTSGSKITSSAENPCTDAPPRRDLRPPIR